MTHYDEEDEFVEYKSRSQRKRESNAVEELAEFLVEMTANQVKVLPLEKDIRDEIRRAQSTGNLAARRRQIKYLAKLLRGLEPEDSDELQTHVAQFRQNKTKEVENFHHIEVWRDRLCKEGAAGVDALARAYPDTDLAPLRDVTRRFQQTQGKHEYHLLFHLLRSVMAEKPAR